MPDRPTESPGERGENASSPAPATSAQERFGPLSLLRTVKDDGRALILYERREPGDGPA
jgi:hypothetical protein